MAHLPIIALEIGPLSAAEEYVLRYFSEEDGGADWAKTALATASLPQSLPDVTGRGWTREDVLDRIENDDSVSSRFGEIGEYLAGLLEIGDVGGRWKTRRQKSRGNAGSKFRTVLRIEPAELRALPWELLRADHRNLFADAENPVYRGVTAANPAPCESLPLRILVVIGARDDEKAKIKWDKELEELRRTLHRDGAVDFDELIRPSRQELITLVRQFRPHVFHFIGHGEMTAANEPSLIFWDAAMANKRAWAIDEMIQDFTAARWTPHMLVLNACRSAQLDAAGKSTAHKSSYELSQALIENGSCCVIGMQGDIRGEASAVFAPLFYRAVLNGQALDSSAADARVAVVNVLGQTRDWALPALHVACAPHEAIPKKFAVENAQSLLTQFGSSFAALEDFVDRRDERRGICWHFLSDEQALQQQNLVILHGAKEIGKSDLVRWCTRHLSLRGRNVHYVDLRGNGGETRTILAAIRRGREGAQGTVLGPLPDAPFAAFDRRLEALENGRPEADDPIAQLCESFLEGLRQLAATEPLIIILDHFELTTAGVGGTIDPNDFARDLKPLLFDGVAAGVIGKLKMLLVMRDEELIREEGRNLAGTARKIPIPAWEAENFEWLARQFVIDAVVKKPEQVEVLTTMYKQQNILATWGPVDLRTFGQWIDTFMKRGR